MRPHRLPVLLVLMVSACTSSEDIEPAVTTSSRAPIALDVGEIVVEAAASPAYAGNFKDKRRSARLVEATTEFLDTRLIAAGGEGLLQATVAEATLIEQPRETEGGFFGLFKSEPDARLAADVGVRLTVIDALGLEQVAAEVKVGRTRAVLEGLDAIERDAVAEDLIEDLLRQLDDKLTEAIDNDLQAYKAF